LRLYCISDCHLGDGSKSDDFKNDTWLISLCEKVSQEEGALLVINGDFFECWQSRFHQIVNAHKEAVQRLASMKKDTVVLIKGNHDGEWCMDLFGRMLDIHVFDKYQIGDILFMHGHQFDEVNSRFKWIGRAVSWIGGMLERCIDKDIDIRFNELAMWITGTGRHGGEKYMRAAVDYTRDKPGVNVIVLGHTHEFFDGVIYKNTGTGIKKEVLELWV